MSKYKFLIVFLMLTYVFSCKKNIEKTTFTEYSNAIDSSTIVYVNIPYAKEKTPTSDSINTTIKKIIAKSLDSNKKTNSTIEESISNFNTEFLNYKIDFPENLEQWEAQIDGEILFQSDKIITIAITSYINTGGAHGSLVISILNFNTQTGKRINNQKLFKNKDQLIKIATPYFKEAIEDKDVFNSIKPMPLPQNIGYSEEGVLLLYNTSEIAPHPSGIIEFIVPFDKVNSILVFNSTL